MNSTEQDKRIAALEQVIAELRLAVDGSPNRSEILAVVREWLGAGPPLHVQHLVRRAFKLDRGGNGVVA
jgi:hypothetical protein